MTEIKLITASQHKLHNCSKQSLTKQRGNTRNWSFANPHTTPGAFDKARERKQNPQIPNPRLFDLLPSSNNGDPIRLPNIAECAIHLELLAAFYQIRRKVLNSTSLDAALSIVPVPQKVYRRKYQGRRWTTYPVNIKDSTFQTRRLAKWPIYLTLAVTRFLKWAWVIEKLELEEPSTSLDAAITLPPIDVLMVWHTLLLNPSLMQTIAFKRLPSLPFPWARIHEAIDRQSSSWRYKLSTPSNTAFQKKTALDPDLFSYLTSSSHGSTLKAVLKEHLHINTTNSMTTPKVNAKAINHILQDDSSDLAPAETEFLRNCSMAVDGKTAGTVSKLVAAIQRQASFVEKMEAHLWIRSPALEGTLTRAVDRYSKFLKLFKLYPGQMLVPTLDVDLVWHTHQCSHELYNAAMTQIAGRLIDHDDKLGKNTLDPGFEKTAALFRVRFGVEYSKCLCWDCEALLDAVEAGRKRSGNTREREKETGDIAKSVQESVAYHRAVEIARRKGDALLPVRG
ncbi:uncharacterized protein BDV14DRAFT_101859 [Aspergillus stella-maris]|uniref:uncharacterized protein n=1 Tax=Aspergillus stella-maris TaxID=1810926 RepID=UPI003CCDE13D